MLPLLHGDVHELVEAAGVFLLVLQALLVAVEHRFIAVENITHPADGGSCPNCIDVVVDFHGVEPFLFRLNQEEVGESVQILRGAVCSHSHIHVGGVKLEVQLLVQFLQQIVAYHFPFPLSRGFF
ncbi:hypothetical protein D3C75_1073180 [compost metagenome]